MLGVKTVAEGMSDNLVGHHPPVPGVGKSSQAVVAARRFEDSFHISHDDNRPECLQDYGGALRFEEEWHGFI
jgi:hypothetical protein